MIARQVKIDAQQRVELVLRVLRKEEPVAVIARGAGISQPTLYRWRDEFFKGGVVALNGCGCGVGK